MHLGTQHQAAERKLDQQRGTELTLKTHRHAHPHHLRGRFTHRQSDMQAGRQTDQGELLREPGGHLCPAEKNVKSCRHNSITFTLEALIGIDD